MYIWITSAELSMIIIYKEPQSSLSLPFKHDYSTPALSFNSSKQINIKHLAH